MEDVKEELAEFPKEYAVFVLDKYLITYPNHMTIETYSCKDFYGIIFVTENGRYDVCHNYLMGDRLIINQKVGGFSDIPFKPATFGFLPEGVEAKEIG